MQDCLILKREDVNKRFTVIGKGIYKDVQFYFGFTVSPDINFETGELGIRAYPVCYIELTPRGIMKGVNTPEEVTYIGPSHIGEETVLGWDYAHVHNKKYSERNIDELGDDYIGFVNDIYEAINSFASD